MNAREREVHVGLLVHAARLEDARDVAQHGFAVARARWDRLEALAAKESGELRRPGELLAAPHVAGNAFDPHGATISAG